MKKLLSLALVCCSLVSKPLGGYQIAEPGLFYAHSIKTPVYNQKKPVRTYEKMADGQNSAVISINGVEDFQRWVLDASWKRPIVVKVFSSVSLSEDTQKMHVIFQQVAQRFKKSLICASVDTFKRYNDTFENDETISQIKAQINLPSLKQPFFIFLKNGALYTPEHLPAPILQGFYPEQTLSAFITAKFSVSPQELPSVSAQDLTTTPTTSSQRNNISDAGSQNSTSKPKQARKSLWQRLFGKE